MRFKVFKRAWWRVENGALVPNPSARRTTLRRNLTESEARAFCKHYNETTPPGRLGIKAEYTHE